MQPQTPIPVSIPLITESIFILQIIVEPNETAAQLCRRIGIYHPSTLCRWPLRARLLPDENVYAIIQRHESLYVHSKEIDVGSAAERFLHLTNNNSQ